MTDYIPLNVIENILARLPGKDVIVCTTVCKEWKSIISHKKFIDLHMNTYKTPDPLWLIHQIAADSCEYYGNRVYLRGIREELFTLFLDSQDRFQEYLMLNESNVLKGLQVVGIWNGIVCLANNFGRPCQGIVLWNPCIHRCFTVSPVTMSKYSKVSAIGFGYDFVRNDFKVFRIFRGKEIFDNALDVPLDGWKVKNKSPNFLESFSLAEGIWTDPKPVSNEFHIDDGSSQVFFDGAVHWMAVGPEGKGFKDVIVALNVGNETFQLLEMPVDSYSRYALHPRGLRYTLTVSGDGKLGLLTSCDVGEGSRNITVFLMSEYGVEASWVKFVVVKVEDDYPAKALCFMRSNEVILMLKPMHYNGNENLRGVFYTKNAELILELAPQEGNEEEFGFELVSLDVKGVTMKPLGIHSYKYYNVHLYKESIVLLDKPKEEKNKSLRMRKTSRKNNQRVNGIQQLK